jgi:tetratricopeptide (TPR) repeat protein
MSRWVARWEAAYAQTCAAELAPAVVDARRRCLQSQRWHAEALTDLLATADPGDAVGAVTAVAALPSPRSCDADAEAGLAGWTPEDPDARATADTFRQRLAAATATTAAGRYREGAQACEALLADLEPLHFEPLALLARLALGRLRVLEGKVEDGRTLLREAYFAAVEAGHDREAAEAATGLTFVVGYQLADPAGGKAWAQHAEAALTRLGLDGEPRAVLLNHRGAIAGLTGELDASREFHEQALAIREPFAEERPSALAHTLNNLGNAWLRLGDYERARDYHARALELRREVYGPAHPSVAVSMNNLGSVVMLTDGPSAARRTFEEALATWEAAVGPDHPDLLQAIHNLTMVAMQEERYTDAEVWLGRARRLAEKSLPPEHPGHALVRSNQAELWLATSQPERAVAELSALVVAARQRYGSTHTAVGDALRTLGRALRLTGRDREAIEHFAQARSVYLRTVGPSHESTQLAAFFEGLARLDLGESRRALALLEPLLAVDLGDEEHGELRVAVARARAATGTGR